MQMFSRLLPKVMMLFALSCLVAVAGCKTVAVTDPCDILVEMTPKPETNRYIVQNDRDFAVQIAQHYGRYQKYKCGG